MPKKPRKARVTRVKLKSPSISHRDLSSEHAWGLADVDDSEIELHTNLNSKDYLYTLIHEIGHCVLPDLSEAQILRFEKIFGDAIWAKGYRKICK